MFNTNVCTSNKQIVSTHVNAVSGNITKTYRNSFFRRFNLQSDLARTLLSNNQTLSCRKKGDYSDKAYEVEVIQMIVCGDMEVIAEVMFKEDYEEMFKKEGE